MPYRPKFRTDEEVDDLLHDCMEAEATGRSKYPGESYEAGISAAIHWLLDTGRVGEHPLTD